MMDASLGAALKGARVTRDARRKRTSAERMKRYVLGRASVTNN